MEKNRTPINILVEKMGVLFFLFVLFFLVSVAIVYLLENIEHQNVDVEVVFKDNSSIRIKILS